MSESTKVLSYNMQGYLNATAALPPVPENSDYFEHITKYINAGIAAQKQVSQLRKALEVAEDALLTTRSVMGTHEMQDSHWDGARDCFKIALAAVRAALDQSAIHPNEPRRPAQQSHRL